MAKKKLPDDCMPACVSCVFFYAEVKDELGFCRRFPPTVLVLGDGEYDCIYPIVEKHEWCGEFIRKVN
jgi:hypothetical protein